MSRAVPSLASLRKGKTSNPPMPICARPSSSISKLGVLRTAGPLKLPSSGLPSKFPADMPTLLSLSCSSVKRAVMFRWKKESATRVEDRCSHALRGCEGHSRGYPQTMRLYACRIPGTSVTPPRRRTVCRPPNLFQSVRALVFSALPRDGLGWARYIEDDLGDVRH